MQSMSDDQLHLDHHVAPQPYISARRRHLGRLAGLVVITALALYLLAAYGAVPAIWKSYESRHPALALAQVRAFTAQGIPGDPINLAFVGQEEDLMSALRAAGWIAADPITWRSSARITVDALAHRAYVSAPVSDLFIHGRKQDLAFEQAFGPDPSKRHHARFWKQDQTDDQGRPLWLGAATFDRRVGVSHLTGQVTHHIDADVDKERDKLASDLTTRAGTVVEWIADFQREHEGKNGGGDPFFTDGRLCLAYIGENGILESTRSAAVNAAQWIQTVMH